MSSLISGSGLIQVAVLRLGFGLVLVGLVSAIQAAEEDLGGKEDFSEPVLNLSTTQFVHSGTDFLLPYQLVSASVVITHSLNTAPIELGFGSLFQLPADAEPHQKTAPPANARWQQAYGNDRVSLSRLLRIEYKGEQVNVALLPRSVSLEGKQFKVTFRAQSALIERERLKVILQPHSASMLWSKPF